MSLSGFFKLVLANFSRLNHRDWSYLSQKLNLKCKCDHEQASPQVWKWNATDRIQSSSMLLAGEVPCPDTASGRGGEYPVLVLGGTGGVDYPVLILARGNDITFPRTLHVGSKNTRTVFVRCFTNRILAHPPLWLTTATQVVFVLKNFELWSIRKNPFSCTWKSPNSR